MTWIRAWWAARRRRYQARIAARTHLAVVARAVWSGDTSAYRLLVTSTRVEKG